MTCSRVSSTSYLERIFAETLRKAREWLISRACLRYERECADGSGNVSAGELDACNVTRLVGEAAGGRGGETSALLLPGSTSCLTSSTAREHVVAGEVGKGADGVQWLFYCEVVLLLAPKLASRRRAPGPVHSRAA
jgi:hypothetical protein